MKELNKLITKKHINFMMTNDRFFKFIFTSKPEDTAYLCNLILGHMLQEQYGSYAIIDSHLHSRQHEKQMIYDLLFEAGNARRINIEMQNYRHPYMMARFDMYLASLFTKGLEDYRYAKQTVQIIFINDRDKEMIDEYEFVNGWKRRSESWKRFFVHLGNLEDIEAFDTGPGNMMINEACRILYQKPYDDGGFYASQGQIIKELIDELMNHPYMMMTPPKSTGREDFGEGYVKSLIDKYSGYHKNDYIKTFTYFTAQSIAYHYQKYIPCHIDKVIVGGGGSHNQTLIQMLKELLRIPVYTQDELGYSSDAKEAIAFAILGNETINHHFSNVKSATGAKDYVILGNVTPKPIL